MRLVLVTFPVSHFCEKARFALNFFGCDFREEAHAPPFHRSSAQGNSVPTFYDEEGKILVGSDAIVSWAQKHAKRNQNALDLDSIEGDRHHQTWTVFLISICL